MGLQKNSPFKHSFDEIFDAAADPVINMSGYLEEIKQKYPNTFKNDLYV